MKGLCCTEPHCRQTWICPEAVVRVHVGLISSAAVCSLAAFLNSKVQQEGSSLWEYVCVRVCDGFMMLVPCNTQKNLYIGLKKTGRLCRVVALKSAMGHL